MARKYGKATSTSKQGELGLNDVRTALYIRVSTEKQANEGYGLEAQRSELDKYCAAQGWRVAPEHIYIDAGVSGKSSDRPAFQAMLEAAKAGQIQRIVATKLDRIARNLKNLLQTVEELKRYDCALVIKKEAFDTSTPQGTFVMQMLGAVAELERSMIGERVHSGRVEKATQGGYNGSRCPIGYSYQNGQFTITERAETVRSIFQMGLAGLSLNAIMRHLNASRTPTPSGKGSWTVAGIKHILANGAYAGLAQWDGVEVAGAYPLIIDAATYEAMQARLKTMTRGQRVDLAA
jgi:site-specific DNA recombinase